MADSIFAPATASKPIREIAYEMLKSAIITGEISAGTRIVETEYASKMHISRTPLREALRKLERDGLVEYILRRGVIVRAFTIEDAYEIYTIRNSLEMLTLDQVIANATDEHIASLRKKLAEMDIYVEHNNIEALSPLARAFHTEIIEISNMPRILRVIEGQDQYITRFSAISIAKEDRRRAAQKEHHQLVDHIENKDSQALHDLMHKHIERSKQNCLLALKETKLRHSREGGVEDV